MNELMQRIYNYVDEKCNGGYDMQLLIARMR